MASTEQTKAIVKGTKFKAGDYIVAPNKVYLKVMAAVDSGMGAMYGLVSPNGTDMRWMSQYQLDQDEFERKDPDYTAIKNVKAGDIFKVGQKKDAVYVTVLARVADAVLLSRQPKKGMAEMMLKMDAMLKEMASTMDMEVEDVLDEEELKEFKQMGSQLHSSKIADDWISIEKLCLMNWELVSEE